MLVYMCLHKLKHFQPHSLLCHLWCISFVISSFVCDIYMIIWKVDEAASTNFFFLIIYMLFHIAIQLHQHSSTSRTITSSQYHPRETRPFFGQPILYNNCYIGIARHEFAIRIARDEEMLLLILFFSSSHFFFLSCNFI